MIRSGDGPAVTNGLVLGPDVGGRAAVLTQRGATLGPALDYQLTEALDHVQDGIDDRIPWQPILPGRQLQATPSTLPHREQPCAHPRLQGSNAFLADGTTTFTLVAAPLRSHSRSWPRLHRLVGLSGLGWAFVLAAVLWEVFALAFSECAGWGWDKGAFFFFWGLGILALGFYLRTSTKRPAVFPFFLGANAVMLSVLSLLVATR